jgi:hypothetical protein
LPHRFICDFIFIMTMTSCSGAMRIRCASSSSSLFDYLQTARVACSMQPEAVK